MTADDPNEMTDEEKEAIYRSYLETYTMTLSGTALEAKRRSLYEATAAAIGVAHARNFERAGMFIMPCSDLIDRVVRLVTPKPSVLYGRSAEQMAQDFHAIYENLAPTFGYKTRKESAKPWSEIPETNRKLMIAVCESIIERYTQS